MLRFFLCQFSTGSSLEVIYASADYKHSEILYINLFCLKLSNTMHQNVSKIFSVDEQIRLWTVPQMWDNNPVLQMLSDNTYEIIT
jgi:hypothetical protein